MPMTQDERRRYLLDALLREAGYSPDDCMPQEAKQQRQLLRGLMNIRMPGSISEGFLAIQDEYLREAIRSKGITDCSALKPVQPGICLWQGDITTLRCDAIVNAANSGMTGCYQPHHRCIDNCIHTYSGIQLRNACAKIMKAQGFDEPTGQAKITPAFNLPCRYVLHTVGPIVKGALTDPCREDLASCYRACLSLAQAHGLKSIALCCISTGVFRFPGIDAAQIAVQTVRAFLPASGSVEQVIFNVFTNEDLRIYREVLSA